LGLCEVSGRLILLTGTGFGDFLVLWVFAYRTWGCF
jgi:hypothetical protein